MKVAVDTNVLVRAVVRDDPAQADLAAAVLTNAELITVALPCLCEFVWVISPHMQQLADPMRLKLACSLIAS
ncbi:hypothetical protein [Chitinimonas arctica]|uniref:hypothetical protein n=1 Tax=Chitinimonas arctica TaxID=2594795 RepID=UPI00402BE0C2